MTRSRTRSAPAATFSMLAVLASFQLLGAPTASAVSFFVTELSGCTAAASQWDCLGVNPLPTQIFTIGIRVKGEPGEQVYGIGASVWGYDSSVVQFVGGEAVESLFHDVRASGIGAGLDNLAAGALSESTCCAAGPRVQMLNALAFSPHSENPLDPGLDGVLGGGDAQIRVRFRAISPGIIQFRIGTDYGNFATGDAIVYAGGQTGPGNNAFIGSNPEDGLYVVQPIPEPGTALLMGIGLAILALWFIRSAKAP